jgi:hypothetical protein
LGIPRALHEIGGKMGRHKGSKNGIRKKPFARVILEEKEFNLALELCEKNGWTKANLVYRAMIQYLKNEGR